MHQDIKSKVETAAAKNIASKIPRENVLRYSIVRQVLWGKFGNVDFGPVEALSGAGQDGVHKRSVKYKDWNPGKAKMGTKVGERGGAIMPGWWIVLPEDIARGKHSPHVSWGAAPTAHSLRIVPYKLDASAGKSTRASFYIHGTGGKGSDGCILLAPTTRQTLAELVSEGGGAWLQAYLSGHELEEAHDASERANHTA